MDFIEKVKLIKKIDYYLQNKSTGKPKELSKKLGVSERNLFRLIKIIESLGCEIEYCSKIESYRYKREGKLKLDFEEQDLNS